MRVSDKTIGVFRMYVGNGTIGTKRKFELCVTTTPAGDITGCPVVKLIEEDGSYHEVVFELDDVLDIAIDAIDMWEGERVQEGE